MRGFRLVLAMGLACVTATAQARDWPLYFGAGYGIAAVDGTAEADGSSIGFPPESFPINGLPFDDDDGTWSAFVGYEPFDFMAVEAGYADFGRLDSSVVTIGNSDPPSIGIENVHLTLRFRFPLTENIAASWHAGVTRSEFDMLGAVAPLYIDPGLPFPLPPGSGFVLNPGNPVFTPPPPGSYIPIGPGFGVRAVNIPFADPKDETGYRWGFGFDWQFVRHLSAGLEFSRENVQVLTLDTYRLRLTAHL